MPNLKFYSRAAVMTLEREIDGNLDWYYRKRQGKRRALVPTADIRIDPAAVENIADQLLMPGSRRAEHDAHNAMTVFNAYRMLTPQQATDERLWTYLTHTQGAEYVSRRWLRTRPESDAAAALAVRNKFFVRGDRALRRENGIARLWWMGRIAHDVDPDEPGLFLKILLARQDARSSLIERPSISRNREVLKAIYSVMRDHAETTPRFLTREPFREFMKNLNRRGGVLLLDALPKNELDSLIRCEAEAALKATAS